MGMREDLYVIVKAFLNAITQLLLHNKKVHDNILCEGAKNEPDAVNYE